MMRHFQILTTVLFLVAACRPTEKPHPTKENAVIVDSAEVILLSNKPSPFADKYPDHSKLFKKYKDTDLYSTTFVDDNKVAYQSFSFEYIKRADTVIVIHKDLLDDFLYLFASNPKSFQNVFANLMDTRMKNDMDTLDFVLGKTKYKTYGVIHEREIIHGSKEVIWQIITHDHIIGNNPCYINLIFNYRSDKQTDDLKNLIFLKAQEEYCEI